MGEFLDEAARILAAPMPRRRAIRLLGSAFAAAIVGHAAYASAATCTPPSYSCGNGNANSICCPPNTCCAKRGNKAACCTTGQCVCDNGTCASSTGGTCPSGCAVCPPGLAQGGGASGNYLVAVPAGAAVAGATLPAMKQTGANCATQQVSGGPQLFSCGNGKDYSICCPTGACCAKQGKKAACCAKGQCVCGNGTCAVATNGACPRGCSVC